MSETASTIVKLLSTLTSPKASVKYISVAIFLTLSWTISKDFSATVEIPGENITIIVLLFGVGVGSLVGHFLVFIFDFTFNYISRIIKERNEKLILQEQNKALINKFTTSFPHFRWEQSEKIRHLTRHNLTLDFSSSAMKSLYENGYVKVISNISVNDHLVKLNPILIDEVSNSWKEEMDSNVDNFLKEKKQLKLKILELMEVGSSNSNEIYFDISGTIASHNSCIVKEAEDDTGFFLTFKPYYNEAFQIRTGKAYKEETWIDRSRIKFTSEQVA